MFEKIDQFVSPFYTDNILRSLDATASFGEETYQLTYSSTTTLPSDDFTSCPVSTSFDMPQISTADNIHPLITPVIEKLMDREQDQVAVIRSKFNIMLPLGGLPPEAHTVPHVDYNSPGVKTAVIYINDAEGDTIVYDKKYTGHYPGDLTPSERMTPKAGSAFIFDSNRYHSNEPPKTGHRIVLNMVYATAEVYRKLFNSDINRTF